MACRGPLLSAAAACTLLLLLPQLAAAQPAAAPAAQTSPNEFLNIRGLPLMMPINRTTGDRRWYYEIPREPVGVLVMLHRCGRNAEDFWPPSSVCPQCIGMPEAVSISRQALARGYALLAINSANRTVGSRGRCWSWATDAAPVKEIVERFVNQSGMGNLPLYFTGCSSGGSLALRLPGIMAMDGIIPVAIGLEMDVFPAAARNQPFQYPPVAYVHFADDEGTDQKVKAMIRHSQGQNLPTAEAVVGKFAVGPTFFSDRDPMISTALSERIYQGLRSLNVLDTNNILRDDWESGGGPAPWDVLLREELEGWVTASRDAQLALKNGSTLAAAQEALGAAGEELLTIQEVSAEANTAADEVVNQQDENPNFSDSDGVSPAGGGLDPFVAPKLLLEHVQEEVAVAWAHHTNLGDFTTAALMWLERCGQANFDNLAETYEVTKPATLSPVRAVPAATVRSAATACQAGGGTPAPTPTPTPTPTPAAPADTRAGEEEAAGNDAGVEATNQAAPSPPANAVRSRTGRGAVVGAVAAAAVVVASALLL